MAPHHSSPDVLIYADSRRESGVIEFWEARAPHIRPISRLGETDVDERRRERRGSTAPSYGLLI